MRAYCEYPGIFPMRRGGQLLRPVIAYETWGALNGARDNAVLIFTGMSPSAHAASSADDPAAGWWEAMVGPGRPIDTRRLFVICVNSLGSCFGSTGPASLNPQTGAPYWMSFPELSLEDVAEAGRFVLEQLGIARLHTLVGPSMGGMTALALALLHPAITRRLLLISTAGSSLPFAIALRALQREMIRSDPAWLDGRYAPGAGPETGMRLARKLGMISYRSAAEWAQRFGRERIPPERHSGNPFAPEFAVEGYLEAHAQKFTGQFDANSYLYLSRASDLFDAAAHGEGSLRSALDRIQVDEALVIGVESDLLFPLAQQRELAAALTAAGRSVELVELPSIQGHDAFLTDIARFGPAVAGFFASRRHPPLRLAQG